MYGYLLLTGLLAGLWALIWAARPDLRRKALISSVASAPLGLANPLFVPEYWDPVVVYRVFGVFDIESFLFSFFVGGVAATLYHAVSGRFVTAARPSLPAYHAGIVVGLVALTVGALFYAKLRAPVPTIVVLHLAAAAGTVYVWSVRPDPVRVKLAGAVAFPTVYAVLLLSTELMVPAFVETQWSGYATFGIRPFGVPVDEFVYAALFGAGWSVVYEIGSSIKRGLLDGAGRRVDRRRRRVV